MKHSVHLDESFDNPLPYRWTLTRESRYAAEFRLPNGTPYIFQFNDPSEEDVWDVSFSREAQDWQDPHQAYNKRYGIVNVGDMVAVQRLFATCVAIMVDFIKRASPKGLMFTAENDEPSRVKLYSQMIKLLPRYVKGYIAEPPFNGGTATQFRIASARSSSPSEPAPEGMPF